ncbi:MAG: 2-amino-4-oxopentanoate thiolase subunit OrtA [Fusobacteriaceae bacterium]
MEKALKGDWVKISQVILSSENRSKNLPKETKKVNLKMWVKGFLVSESDIGDTVKVVTKTGRIESGILEEIDPTYRISFGNYIPELATIGINARKELSEVNKI